MKARIYLDGSFVAECPLALPMNYTRGTEDQPRVNGRITVVLFDDHPSPGQRPMFFEGRVEQA